MSPLSCQLGSTTNDKILGRRTQDIGPRTLNVHIPDRFVVHVAVNDNPAGVLAGYDPVSLTDLDLSLRGYGEAGGGSSLEGHHGPAVAQTAAKALIGAEIARIDCFLSLPTLFLQSSLLVLCIVQDLTQLAMLCLERLVQLGQPSLSGFNGCGMGIDVRVDFHNSGLGIGNALTLRLDLLRQSIILTVVTDLELLLLILLDQALGLLNVELRTTARDLILRLLLLVLLDPSLQTFLFVLQISDFIRKIAAQFLDLVDSAVNVLETNQSFKLFTDAGLLDCGHTLVFARI